MSKIKKPEELPVKKTVIGGIYGQAGAGKSTTALSLPKPLLLDTDNGLHRVQAQYRCDSVQVENYQDVLDVLKEDLSAYETIVIDTLGKLVDFMCESICKEHPNLLQKDGTMAIKAWGLVKNQFKTFINNVRKLNKNLIFVAHEKESTEGDTRIIRPDVAGSAGKDIIKELDFLGYVEIINNKRTISFTPNSKFYAKNSLQLKQYVEIPNLINEDENNFLTNFILKPTIEKRINEFKDLEKYNEIINQAKDIINDDCNLDKLRKLPVIGDSQLRIKAMIDKHNNLQK